MPDGKKLDIAIPAGIDDQQVLRLKGQGLPSADGKVGDVFVEITIRPHPDFKRDGTDIQTTVPISLGESLNGASVRVATIDGTVDVKIPKNAKHGMQLRLRGRGVARGKSGKRGDQIVVVRIVPPHDADEALANFIAEWEKIHPQYPRGKGGI
jgi:DnaJ-class molecular chaperone